MQLRHTSDAVRSGLLAAIAVNVVGTLWMFAFTLYARRRREANSVKGA
jgi:hypothetical protein